MLEQLLGYAVLAFAVVVGLGVLKRRVRAAAPAIVKDTLDETGKVGGKLARGAIRVGGGVLGSVTGVAREPRIPRGRATWITVAVLAAVAAAVVLAAGPTTYWWATPAAALTGALAVAVAGRPTLVDMAVAQGRRAKYTPGPWVTGMLLLAVSQAATAGTGLLVDAGVSEVDDLVARSGVEPPLLVAAVAALQVVVTAGLLGVRLRTTAMQSLPMQPTPADVAYLLDRAEEKVRSAGTRARVDRRTKELTVAPLPHGVRGADDDLDEAASTQRLQERLRQLYPGYVIREHTTRVLRASPRTEDEIAELRALQASGGLFTGPVGEGPLDREYGEPVVVHLSPRELAWVVGGADAG